MKFDREDRDETMKKLSALLDIEIVAVPDDKRNPRYPKQWTARGRTSSDLYVISLTTTGAYQCSCPAWKFRREKCKHVQALEQELKADQS